MRMIDTVGKRIGLVVFAVLTAGLGIFFLNQDLGTADQYASVASFFVSLLALGMSIAPLLANTRLSPPSPTPADTMADPGNHSQRPHPNRIDPTPPQNYAINCDVVQQGPYSVANVVTHHHTKSNEAGSR
jgi:hypothetical protein